jgi:hypothetical protein
MEGVRFPLASFKRTNCSVRTTGCKLCSRPKHRFVRCGTTTPYNVRHGEISWTRPKNPKPRAIYTASARAPQTLTAHTQYIRHPFARSLTAVENSLPTVTAPFLIPITTTLARRSRRRSGRSSPPLTPAASSEEEGFYGRESLRRRALDGHVRVDGGRHQQQQRPLRVGVV